MGNSLLLLHDGVSSEVSLAADGRAVIGQAQLDRVLGWELKPEGLCRDDVCVPVDRDALAVEGGLDLAAVAASLGRPLARDAEHGVAAIGAAADDRGSALRGLAAPDFSLPDLDGRMHSLSEQRGMKVFLVAYASW